MINRFSVKMVAVTFLVISVGSNLAGSDKPDSRFMTEWPALARIYSLMGQVKVDAKDKDLLETARLEAQVKQEKAAKDQLEREQKEVARLEQEKAARLAAGQEQQEIVPEQKGDLGTLPEQANIQPTENPTQSDVEPTNDPVIDNPVQPRWYAPCTNNPVKCVGIGLGVFAAVAYKAHSSNK